MRRSGCERRCSRCACRGPSRRCTRARRVSRRPAAPASGTSSSPRPRFYRRWVSHPFGPTLPRVSWTSRRRRPRRPGDHGPGAAASCTTCRPTTPTSGTVKHAASHMYKALKARAAHPQAGGGAGRRPGGDRGHRDRLADADRRRDPGHPAGLAARRAPSPASCSTRAAATSARPTTRWSTPSTTTSARAAPRCRTPSATSAPTSPGVGPCSPAGGPRSGCTSRSGCCATARTPRSRPASRTTPYAGSRRSRTAADWIHRLKIVGIDLRDPTQVVALADEVAAAGPLDVLINNAAQTVRRSPGAYSRLVELESGAAAGRPRAAGAEVVPSTGSARRTRPRSPGTLRRDAVPHHDGESARRTRWPRTPRPG